MEAIVSGCLPRARLQGQFTIRNRRAIKDRTTTQYVMALTGNDPGDFALRSAATCPEVSPDQLVVTSTRRRGPPGCCAAHLPPAAAQRGSVGPASSVLSAAV